MAMDGKQDPAAVADLEQRLRAFADACHNGAECRDTLLHCSVLSLAAAAAPAPSAERRFFSMLARWNDI
jgi:hypothetical protein